MIRLVSWNMNRRRAAWAGLDDLAADVALLQEAGRPGAKWALAVGASSDRWETAGMGCAPLSDRGDPFDRPGGGASASLRDAGSVNIADDWVAVSRTGSIAAADVVIDGDIAFTAVSVYAAWETSVRPRRGYADGTAHRILSDLSLLLGGRRPPHRMIVAGDWNLLRGYGENGDGYWKARYDTVFERAEALGLRFVGPEYPNGRQADPWPDELPSDSLCVPNLPPLATDARHRNPSTSISCSPRRPSRTAERYVRSETPEAWGPSDHCRVYD